MYSYSVTPFTFVAPLFHWLRLSVLKLKIVRQPYYYFTVYKNCRAFWDRLRRSVQILEVTVLLSLPPHKLRVCHVALTDSVNYHAVRRVLQCVWFVSSVVKIVYMFQTSKWGSWTATNRHTGITLVSFVPILGREMGWNLIDIHLRDCTFFAHKHLYHLTVL